MMRRRRNKNEPNELGSFFEASLLGVAGDTGKSKEHTHTNEEKQGHNQTERPHVCYTQPATTRWNVDTWLTVGGELVVICRCRSSKTSRGRRQQRSGEQNCAHM